MGSSPTPRAIYPTIIDIVTDRLQTDSLGRGLRIGLTGGMGCGKSTVGDLLEKKGFRRKDADRIVRELLEGDQEVIGAIKSRYGENVFVTGSQLDRVKLAQIVFADEQELKWLEQLLHPRVRSNWEQAVKREPEKNWVVEIPLLFENRLETCFDSVIAVFVDEAEQWRRLLRKGFSRETISARLSRQWSVSLKAEAADFVLLNQGSVSFLEEQTDYFLQTIQNFCPTHRP